MAGSHRIPLADGWSMWKWAQLRTPGFCARMVTDLAAPLAAKAADALVDARNVLARVLDAAIVEVSAAHNDIAADNARKALRKLVAAAERQDWSSLKVPADAPARSSTAALGPAIERVRVLDGELASLLASQSQHVSAILRSIAEAPRFREAVLWQNRHALLTGLDALLRSGPERNDTKQRQRERLIANYVQRYATKNETIGFFGPVAWATLHDDPSTTVTVRSRPDVLAQRKVYFEHWAIDALAQTFARDPALLPHLAPRRMPTIRIEGTTLFHSSGSEELPVAYAVVLAACDGETPASSIADTALANESLELSDASEVFDMLEQLADKRVITWTLEVPVGLVPARPEQSLRTILARIAEPNIRDTYLAKLDTLLSLRDELEASAGDTPRLDRAMTALIAAFEQATGLDAERNHGKAYAGRTLVYEECVSDVTADIGAGVFRMAATPLALVLQSARWFTAELAARYRALATEIFEGLRGDADRVDYVRFWEAMAPHLANENRTEPELVRAVAAELQARWARILLGDRDRTARCITLLPEDIAAAVADLFAADRPGWQLARFQAPDMMIAAANVEAIARGDFQLVLGELHIAVASLFFVGQRPDPKPLFDAAALDLPETTLSPTESKEHVTRVDYPPLKPGDYQFEIGPSRSCFPRSHVLPAAELEVVRAGDRPLMVATRDGRHEFDLMDVVGNYLSFVAVSSFKMLASAAHLPRVTIGKLVVERERWVFEPDRLGFAVAKSAAERFVMARAWAAEHGIPRFIFVKTPEETKPMFIDLESPMLIEMFAGRVRQASTVTIGEMLPDLDQLWLRDPVSGDAYTSEIRMAVVDGAR